LSFASLQEVSKGERLEFGICFPFGFDKTKRGLVFPTQFGANIPIANVLHPMENIFSETRDDFIIPSFTASIVGCTIFFFLLYS
jgi:phosphotransferase system  glucose/maltose/N-acetylglucosamine-specific IIC component